MVQSFANILSARWGFKGAVLEGSYCTAQAVLKQVGNDGVAWFTIAIAVLTFIQVLLPSKMGRDGRRYFVGGAIVFIFGFLVLMVAIPATIDHPYYGNTGLWCWIKDQSPSTSKLRIASEYAFMWLAVVISFICYGAIVIKWLSEAAADRDPRLRRDAISMGWYPIAYVIVVAPQSIVRFLQFQPKGAPPHGWTILSSVLFTSGGTLNVVLWIVTGRRFGFTAASPSARHREQIRSTGTDVEAPRTLLSSRSNHIPLTPNTPLEPSFSINGGGSAIQYPFTDGFGTLFPDTYPPSPSVSRQNEQQMEGGSERGGGGSDVQGMGVDGGGSSSARGSGAFSYDAYGRAVMNKRG